MAAAAAVLDVGAASSSAFFSSVACWWKGDATPAAHRQRNTRAHQGAQGAISRHLARTRFAL